MDPEAGIQTWMLVIWGSMFVFSLVVLPFWIWMLVDCVQNVKSENNEKLIWVLVIIFASWIGALIYFFVQRPKNRLIE